MTHPASVLISGRPGENGGDSTEWCGWIAGFGLAVEPWHCAHRSLLILATGESRGTALGLVGFVPCLIGARRPEVKALMILRLPGLKANG
jgi:hypothetical protein